MNKKLLALVVLTFAAMLGSSFVYSADAVTDGVQVKEQAPFMAEIEALVVTTGGYQLGDVEISSTAHQITIAIINSKLNTGASVQRETEASQMVSAVVRVVAQYPAFFQLQVIHVDYVKRQDDKLKPVQRIDFFQSSKGMFLLHKT
jgi:hypothetical protein